jgi:hypothetical protein
MNRSLNEATSDKIRKYCADCNDTPPNDTSFMSVVGSTSGSEFVLLFLNRLIGKLIFFFCSFISHNMTVGRSHFRRTALFSILKSKCDSILVKEAVLRITLNIDGAPIVSQTHTHPSHSQTSRLLSSSLSLGVPVPRAT